MNKKEKKAAGTMQKLLAKDKEEIRLPKAGDLIEGTFIKMGKNAVMLELGPIGIGIVYGAELKENKSILKELKIGKKISALVIDPENEDGYVELSLKEANLEKGWTNLQKKKQTGEPISARVIEANRGGLVVEVSGIIGFLPVSQLSSKNYPRVEGGDKNKILQHLNKFIRKEMQVKIISMDKKTDKLIVSEKILEEKKAQENLSKYKKGDIVDGTVAALTGFGAFIKFDDNLEGLAHISELDWQIIDHPKQVLQENEQVKAKIIDIQDNHVSLSIKALKKDPWENIEEKYQEGQNAKGIVTKITPAGAFVQVDGKIHGLAHSSKPANNSQELKDILEIGKSYNFEILSLAPKMRKMSLELNDLAK